MVVRVVALPTGRDERAHRPARVHGGPMGGSRCRTRTRGEAVPARSDAATGGDEKHHRPAAGIAPMRHPFIMQLVFGCCKTDVVAQRSRVLEGVRSGRFRQTISTKAK